MTFHRCPKRVEDGQSAQDGWSKGQAGFRLDWNRLQDFLTVQGETYRATESLPPSADQAILGTDVLGRWRHQSEHSEVQVERTTTRQSASPLRGAVASYSILTMSNSSRPCSWGLSNGWCGEGASGSIAMGLRMRRAFCSSRPAQAHPWGRICRRYGVPRPRGPPQRRCEIRGRPLFRVELSSRPAPVLGCRGVGVLMGRGLARDPGADAVRRRRRSRRSALPSS